MGTDSVNPIRKLLLPAYKEWQAKSGTNLVSSPIELIRRAQYLMGNDRSGPNRELVLTNLLEMLVSADLNRLRSHEQKDIFDLIFQVMNKESVSGKTKKLAD